MTTNTTNSQAASIRQDQDFRALLGSVEVHSDAVTNEGAAPSTYDQALTNLCAHIDAKLVQAKLRGMELANEKVFQPDMDEWKARAEKAESRLAEIQRGASAIPKWKDEVRNKGIHESYEPEFMRREIEALRALLQPQGQADTSGLPG